LKAQSTAPAPTLHSGAIYPATVTADDARKAWEQFKRIGITSEHTPGPNMLRQFWKGDTRGEYQAWALIMAVMHDDPKTAQGLWNFCKHYIPLQMRGLVPWLIREDPKDFHPSNVADADFDYAIALDVAARKWPDYRDDEGKSWADWATYFINRIYDTHRAVLENPESPNAITGKGTNPQARFFNSGKDEHYYLHYSPYGYLQNWQNRTGNLNWTQTVDGLPSVLEAEIALQKPTLATYYGLAEVNPYSWPPHQVRKDGTAANDLLKKYDSGWDMFNWGPGRIAARATHAYTNYGIKHGEFMMRFLAERFLEETGGDPEKIRTGYRAIGKGVDGWGDPNLWHVGHAAMVAMVDEKYAGMRDAMALALAKADTSADPQLSLAQAYYLMHLTGLMDFRIENPPSQ
jgi:hypothetical protein